jgi:uncharacterized protein YbjT (DUF2867 family)
MATQVPKTQNPLRVIVLGPTGLGGSAMSIELLNRGHHVTGMSRNPQKLGNHERYHPVSVDLTKVGPDDLIELFKGCDVLIE